MNFNILQKNTGQAYKVLVVLVYIQKKNKKFFFYFRTT